MLKITSLCLLIILSGNFISQNVGINSTGVAPDNSAALDISATDKGILIPRVTSAQRAAIASPATGLLVYDLTLSDFYYFDGVVWSSTGAKSEWKILGNTGTNAATNFIGTTDATDLVIRTTNTEKVRVTSGGNVGIGITLPIQKLDVQGGNARINNTFIGDVGHGAGWGGISHSSQISTTGYSLISSSDGNYTLINKQNTGAGFIGFRQGNVDMAVIDFRGNMGIGTTGPNSVARLQVVGGSIMPATGNSSAAGIFFPENPGGGGGDFAYIRHYVESGENTKLVIANGNDSDDDIDFQTGSTSRINIDGDGSVTIAKGVLFDCNDCGSTTTIDGTGNWGDLVIQGRVLSSNSNIHLSPPGGTKVIINSSYRSAGGATGTTGLDIEDGGIRMRKNYRYYQRYFYTTSSNGYDGAATYNLGSWDFCSLAHFGFKNNASSTDEDDDAQCAVYPNGAGAGEQTNYDYYFTEQYNTKRTWYMYMEAYEDTNGITCGASCMNFE